MRHLVALAFLAAAAAQPPYFADIRKTSFPLVDANTLEVFVADLNGDGRMDLVPGCYSSAPYHPGAPRVYWARGRGRFEAGPIYNAKLTTQTAVGDLAGDVDGDGRLDVAIDGLVIHRNTPTGFRTERYTNWYGGFGPIAFADLDGDGHLDLVCGNGCYPAWYSCNRHTDSPPESVVWNDGRGGFPAEQVLPTPLSNTRATAVGDVDEDGDVDVVYGNIDYPNTPIDQLVLNDGGRAFRNVFYSLPPDAFPLDTGDTRDLFLADLDFDGDLDLVAIDETPADTGLPVSRVYANLKRHLRTPDLARLGLPYRIWVEGASQGAILLLAAGPGRVATPFGRFGLDPATTVVAATFGPPAQGRRAASDPTVPADPALLDSTLWWQAAVLDANRVRLTNVVADDIGW